ncbi:Pro-kumamolisin, activation domain-containing protein [Mycena polygramma]|nr:Pro-kumamolisin, activation domain-containing protein [Mycena polygramma]
MPVLFSLAFATITTAQTISLSVLHAKRDSPPAGWSRVRRHAPDALLPLRFGLTQPNVDMTTLEELLNDVSHPDSPNYGNHWTRVAEHFAPSDEAVRTLVSWISENGFSRDRVRVSKTKGWVMLNASVAETESLLKTEYNVFVHESSGQEHVACDEYYLPAHVAPHVAIVTPSLDFNAFISKRSDSAPTHVKLGHPGAGTISPKLTATVSNILHDLDHCGSQITPACRRALYGFYYLPHAAPNNSYAIVEFTPNAYRAADLDLFAKNFPSSVVGARPVLRAVDGGVQTAQKGSDFNGESNLDLEYAMNLVTARQPVTLYQVGDLEQGPISSFNTLLDALDGSFCSFEGGDEPQYEAIYPDTHKGGSYKGHDCGTIKPAHVISTSYGTNEADLSAAYTARQCAEYAKLGLMGATRETTASLVRTMISWLKPTSPGFLLGNRNVCLNRDGTGTENGKIWNPTFPSTCPFVTSVGATQINDGKKVTDPEVACDAEVISGGGFSNRFRVPHYQKSAGAGYLFNSTGTSRAYPDLSADGNRYVIANDRKFELVSGTSASTPVVGAMLAMINDARLAIHKKPIGFINPTIYSPKFKRAFNDTTSGRNPGCGTAGFAAAKGFDSICSTFGCMLHRPKRTKGKRNEHM